MAGKEFIYEWLNDDDNENGEENGTDDLLKLFYITVANGPMTSYRKIRQYGAKQGQSYYMHVLDGISTLHKLCESGMVAFSELEERLLLTAFTIHDLNKIWSWRFPGKESQKSYTRITTAENVAAELGRLKIELFFPGWETYLNDITLLAHYHQHDAAPLHDLDHRQHNFGYDHSRLEELGVLMRGVDNLDLSHTLGENPHKQEFLLILNEFSGRTYKWLTHRMGENRGLLTNLIHNQIVLYLQERARSIGKKGPVDLLYYPEGVAYLISERELFVWSDADNINLSGKVARAVAAKQGAKIKKFINPKQQGVKVDKSVLEGGASFSDILYVIMDIVERKRYKEDKYSVYMKLLRSDLLKAAENPSTAELARPLLDDSSPILPLEQVLFQRGELATAYRNLLKDHLKARLKPLKLDSWTHLYQLLGLPGERYPLYNQVNSYRRGYFLARDCPDSLEVIFEKMLEDVMSLTGEQVESNPDDGGVAFQLYLTTNLEFSSGGQARDFKAQFNRYIKDEHKQCSNCSSPLPAEEWMAANAPTSVGVQVFSNRLVGGSSRDPKRNICSICRTQFILEKLAWTGHSDKQGKKYTTFYMHIYPYVFFSEPQLGIMYDTLKGIASEDSQAFFFQASAYFSAWDKKVEENQAQRFVTYRTKVNGLPVPNFSEVVGNIPTLPFNSPGASYGQQFLFALTHALMLADFFGCRVVMSRSLVPLFSGEYLDARQLSFIVDGVPRNLRWLLPADEYRSLEVYRTKQGRQTQAEADAEYNYRKKAIAKENLDDKGGATFENIAERLRLLYRLAAEIKPNMGGYEEVLLDLVTIAADDPFALYVYTERAIEKKTKDTANRELATRFISKRVVPLLLKINRGGES